MSLLLFFEQPIKFGSIVGQIVQLLSIKIFLHPQIMSKRFEMQTLSMELPKLMRKSIVKRNMVQLSIFFTQILYRTNVTSMR